MRDPLVAGLGLLLLLAAGGGLAARGALTRVGETIETTIAAAEDEASLAARLATVVTRAEVAAARHVADGDSASGAQGRGLALEGHALVRQVARRPGRPAREAALVAEIERRLSALEARHAVARRLVDLRRPADAARVLASAAPMTSELLADVQRLGESAAARTRAEGTRLAEGARAQATTTLVVTLVIVALGIGLGAVTLGSLDAATARLLRRAQALATGTAQEREGALMPAEFRALEGTLDAAAEHQARLGAATARAAEDVSGTTGTLVGVADGLTASLGRASAAMTDVTAEAASQARELRALDGQLRGVRERAEGVLAGAEEVTTHARAIEETSGEKRLEVERAITILGTVRGTVRASAGEVEQLTRAVDDVSRFVVTVGRIAEQTNLLALNAAIEAARAGAAGRGFAVVAEEVRRLAEQAQAAAEDVVRLTQEVTRRVATASRTMETSVGSVGEIESVSRGLDEALAAIGEAAERTRQAASRVTFGAMENAQAVDETAGRLQVIADRAERHAGGVGGAAVELANQVDDYARMAAAAASLREHAAGLRSLLRGTPDGGGPPEPRGI